MKIIFAPAKMFKDGTKSKNFAFKFEETKYLVDKVKNWTKEEYLKNFSISIPLYNEVYSYYNDFDINESYYAYSLYNGQSYANLDYNSLEKQEQEYIVNNVYILDALYGIINFNDSIRKYRMDFNTKGLDIRDVWSNKINTYFNGDEEELLSLASEEFSSLITNKKIYKVSFVDIVNGKKKKVSVYNKQMRGKLLRYMAINQIENINDLPIKINGYKKEVKNFDIEYIKEN